MKTFNDLKVNDCILITYVCGDKMESTTFLNIDKVTKNDKETVFHGQCRSQHTYFPHTIVIENKDLKASKLMFEDTITKAITIVSATNLSV